MIAAARTSETSVYNYFTRQYIPEDNSELQNIFHYFWAGDLLITMPLSAQRNIDTHPRPKQNSNPLFH
jgi:hypothetical protein